jgi:hypothetical protein
MKITAVFKHLGNITETKEFTSDLDFYTARRVWISRSRGNTCEVITGKKSVLKAKQERQPAPVKETRPGPSDIDPKAEKTAKPKKKK